MTATILHNTHTAPARTLTALGVMDGTVSGRLHETTAYGKQLYDTASIYSSTFTALPTFEARALTTISEPALSGSDGTVNLRGSARDRYTYLAETGTLAADGAAAAAARQRGRAARLSSMRLGI